MLLTSQAPGASAPPSAPQPPAALPQAQTPAPVTNAGVQPHHFVPPPGADKARWLSQLGDQLSGQIESARGRRTALARQYEAATGANRAGLEQQLAILDQRIAQLEVDIADVGVQKAQTFPTTMPAPAFDAGPLISGVPNALIVLFCFILLLPVSIAVAKRIWRRPKETVRTQNFDETAVRLERVEQALETIAIEIERVSEGQRYVSKILSTQDQGAHAAANAVPPTAVPNGAQPLPALGPGSPDPIVMQQREEVRVRRS